MRARVFNLLLLVVVLALPHPLAAEIGAIDVAPAATLLLPYFEVDLTDYPSTVPPGITTLFSLNNASDAPALAHVTFWTDLSVPTLDFNVFLTGWDVVTINLRDVFKNGIVPVTSHINTAISPRGVFSLTTNPVSGVGPGSTSCDGNFPLPPVPPILLQHIRAAHTGKASPLVFSGLCSGIDHDDVDPNGGPIEIARGYITIDVVNFCTLDFPGDVGYWISGGLGTGSNVNQLWGDFFFVNAQQGFAQGENLVHIEADNSLGAANYTFYRRYSGGPDQREGLGSTFAVRYIDGGAFAGGTDIIVWRDSKTIVAPFSCNLTAPSPFPLAHNQIVIFDEAENPEVPEASPFSPAIPGDVLLPFPWETTRTPINGPDLPVANPFGWLYLNLNNNVVGSLVPFEPLMQNWVMVLMEADGQFSIGYDAMPFDNVTDPVLATDIELPVCDGAPDPAACN